MKSGDRNRVEHILRGPEFSNIHFKAALIRSATDRGWEFSENEVNHLLSSRSEAVRAQMVRHLRVGNRSAEYSERIESLSDDPSSLVRDEVLKALLLLPRDSWTDHVRPFFFESSFVVSATLTEAITKLAARNQGELPADVLQQLKERKASLHGGLRTLLIRRRTNQLLERYGDSD